MKKLVKSLVAIALVVPGLALADEPIPRYSLGNDVIHGGPVNAAKAGGDTINLMSFRNDPTNGPGEPVYFGDFEDDAGGSAWNGWTSRDLTQKTVSHWQVSGYQQADPSDLAAWCGDINYPACDDSLDPAGGYGNGWHDILAFRYAVPEPALPTTLTVTASVQLDVEPGYDYFHLSVRDANGFFSDLQVWDGQIDFNLVETAGILPAEYLGGSEAALYFRVTTDRVWSDEDCLHPTAGAVQIDDVGVHLENGATALDFFTDFQDGTFGDWAIEFPTGVGDFAQVWEGLEDADPCGTNYTPQVAFIDDGLVVPGTGGSDCINWCYGPAGYIVNTTGGLAGPDFQIHDVIESPVMDNPVAGDVGAVFQFDVYRHEDLSADAPGIFYTWALRSADTDGSAGHGARAIQDAPWENRGFVYYGGPNYLRDGGTVSDLLDPGWDEIQVQLGIYEVGWVWGWVGNDGYPAPYFDNVTVKVFPLPGPNMAAREIDLAQDNFPERGSIDFEDLGSLHVRFDMARNISLRSHLRNDPGDSLFFEIDAARSGAELLGNPVVHYALEANPLFDPYRSSGLPDRGTVPMLPYLSQKSAVPIEGMWTFDLPDTGFFFPGDVLHYYAEATSTIDFGDPLTSILPADTTGFGHDFDDPLGYDPAFTVRALPTITEDGFGGYRTPLILFWNDFGDRGGRNEWYTAWNQLGAVPGDGYGGYDIYYTNGPTSGVGNGLGGRALSPLNLEHYEVLVYTAGDLATYTIANGDFNNDPSPDVQVLRGWLATGGKNAFFTGDGLATDLTWNGGSDGLAFAEDVLGVSAQTNDIRSYINNQANPLVQVEPGNGIIGRLDRFLAYGGCPGINTFDGVVPIFPAVRLAQFLDVVGLPGAYPFSALTWNTLPEAPSSRVLSMPLDFMFVHDDAKSQFPHGLLPDRTTLLWDVMDHFGQEFIPGPRPNTPGTLKFTVANHPNPFNPATRIVYTVPKAGHLSLKVYDIRGMLVKTLVNEKVEAGADQVAMWDGSDDGGAAVSSGVYFWEARTDGEVKVGKMALIK